MVKNKHIVRVGAEQISLYNTMRLAERFAGIPDDYDSRSQFIRKWAADKQSEPIVQSFLYQGLRLKTKAFGTNLKKMEARLGRLHEYAKKTASWNDKQRLKGALSDLEKSGYLVRESESDELEVNVTSVEAGKITTYGMIAMRKDEFNRVADGWLKDDFLVLNMMSYFPATYIAVVDALEIAGFPVKTPDSFKKGELLELRLSTSRESGFRKLLETLPVPEVVNPLGSH